MMEDLHARHEDVAADASRAAAAYLSVALAATQRHVQRRAAAALRASLPPLPPLPTPVGPAPATAPGRAAGVARHAAQDLAARDVTARNPAAQDLAGRYAGVARRALPELALLADPGWPQLAAELHRHAAAGTDPGRLLQQTAAQRELDSARHPAQVLTRRLQPGNAAQVARRSHPPLAAGGALPGARTRAPSAGQAGSATPHAAQPAAMGPRAALRGRGR